MFVDVRNTAIHQVLGTDMKKHFDILSRFQVSFIILCMFIAMSVLTAVGLWSTSQSCQGSTDRLGCSLSDPSVAPCALHCICIDHTNVRTAVSVCDHSCCCLCCSLLRLSGSSHQLPQDVPNWQQTEGGHTVDGQSLWLNFLYPQECMEV